MFRLRQLSSLRFTEMLAYIICYCTTRNKLLAGWRGSIRGRGTVFHFSTVSSPVLGLNKPPIQRVPVPVFPGVKRQSSETDH
jgi:hypothetical protein